MNFLNFGFSEILLIIVIAIIIFGPTQMVKTAKDAGAFLRKVAKSPYWKEVWATKKDIEEIPKMLAKEAELNETLRELDKDSHSMNQEFSNSIREFIVENDKIEGNPSAENEDKSKNT